MRWRIAQLECERWGGDLVSIGSVAEHRFVANLTDVIVNAKCFWIGLNFRDRAFRNWVWANGSAVDVNDDFTYWGAGQPDTADQQCVLMGGWSQWDIVV